MESHSCWWPHGGPLPIVTSIAVAFIASALLTLICERIRLPSVAGFILAGLVVGPVGLGLISDPDEIETIAGLGLTLLLFLIGLELDLGALMASGRTLIVTGLLQVPITVAIGYALFAAATALGLGTVLGGADAGSHTTLYLALACGFSSTLLVVKALQERLQIDTVDGRLCLGLLIFQDIWAIVILALQPKLGAFDAAPLIATLLGVAIVILVAGLVARYLLPRAFMWVAKSPELVVTLALGWCFGLGLFAAQLGPRAEALALPGVPSVSMELGALVAGASIATFPYAHEVVSKASNLRDFFITLFFVALGMSIPIPDGPAVLFAALALVGIAFVLRYLVFLPLLYLTGLNRRNATTTSTKLAQVSEFALVIAYLGLSLGHIDSRLVSVVIFAFVITAILTPTLFTHGDALYFKLATPLRWVGIRDDREAAKSGDEDPPRLVLLGFHRLASSLLEEIAATHPELLARTLVLDVNVGIHDRIRARGVHVHYCDISSPAALRSAAEAELILSTIPDDLLKGITNLELARQLRAAAPDATIIVNAIRIRDIPAMREAGADYVFSWRTEAAIGVSEALCAALNGDLDGFIEHRRLTHGDPASRDEVLE